MKKAYIFPGQGAQFVGMGKDLYDQHEGTRVLFEEANDILGFRITDLMFSGTDEDLRQTKVTQPAIFLHSVLTALCREEPMPEAMAGHSLGEFSALVVSGCLSFGEGLRLVQERALAMQFACEKNPSTMAAILGLADATVEEICAAISTSGEVVVPANYNCPGQLVISGSNKGIELACEKLKEAGAKRALPLKVGGAFHSPLMEPAALRLKEAIANTTFHAPKCPIYQNVDAQPYTEPQSIRLNLERQLTAPVRWTQTVKAMMADGVEDFVELGPGTVLTGLVGKCRG